MKKDTARIHSIETCGTVDGPGIRYVIFFQGCPLRCKYCHNPDTWRYSGGTEMTMEEILQDIRKYKNYINYSGGGVTATGGEPLMQAPFIARLFKALKAEGIHTALDTSGHIPLSAAEEVLHHTDLVLLDIKSFNPENYKQLTGAALEPTLRMAAYLEQRQIPVWLRFVLVPGLTDYMEDIRALADFAGGLSVIKRVDILPFHKMGEYKWAELGLSYELTDTPAPDQALTESVRDIFRKRLPQAEVR